MGKTDIVELGPIVLFQRYQHQKEDIGYEAIMGIIDRYIERDINWEDGTC